MSLLFFRASVLYITSPPTQSLVHSNSGLALCKHQNFSQIVIKGLHAARPNQCSKSILFDFFLTLHNALLFLLAEKNDCKSLAFALKLLRTLEKLSDKSNLTKFLSSYKVLRSDKNPQYSFSNLNQHLNNNLQSPLATTLFCHPWVNNFYRLTSWVGPALGVENRKNSRALSVTQKGAENPGQLER